MNVGLVFVGGANVASVRNALRKVGVESSPVQSAKPCDLLILPGVGRFGTAMERLSSTFYKDFILEHHQRRKPIIGICLGLQLMFCSSEEDEHIEGLSLLPGKICKLPCAGGKDQTPNIGYRWVEFRNSAKGSNLDRPNDSYFYFLHSYAALTHDFTPDRVGVTRFSDTHFISYFSKDNLHGIQFHPERSAQPGLKFLSATIAYAMGTNDQSRII